MRDIKNFQIGKEASILQEQKEREIAAIRLKAFLNLGIMPLSDAAFFLGMREKDLLEACKNGDIIHFKQGEYYYFKVEYLRSYMERGKFGLLVNGKSKMVLFNELKYMLYELLGCSTESTNDLVDGKLRLEMKLWARPAYNLNLEYKEVKL